MAGFGRALGAAISPRAKFARAIKVFTSAIPLFEHRTLALAIIV
jgi:hypothetical protein